MDKSEQKRLIEEIMELDAKNGMYDTVNDTVNELDKLAYQYNPVMKLDAEFIRAGFKAGYLKAKETLYTEEQVNQEMIDFAEWCRTQYKINGDVFLIEQLFSEYKSIKQ